MSVSACHMHGGTDGGYKRAVFTSLVSDGFRFTAYKKYCAECLMRIAHEHRSDWLPGAFITRANELTACTSCGEVVSGEAKLKPFFVTIYGPGPQQTRYYAAYCADCADIAKHSFELEETRNGRH